MKAFWQGLGRGARIGLVAGALLVVAVTAVGGWLLLRPDQQVLFAGLTPQDAAAIVTELEKQKVPHAIAEQDPDGGTTILVDGRDVYRTRLKVMGRDLPLHGAVGFELFDESDFGMTEFAQRINYQRALQGELTRTILSLSEVRDARVLLALPEQGLFKQATSRSKASVTLTLKNGQGLRREQVLGIQRLVSAAVPGIATADVTIVDQRGVALSHSTDDGGAESGSARLDLKRETEGYLARKAGEVLEQALGPGEAIASVDVTLDLDQVQTTTDRVLGADRPGRAPAGVIVRERDTARQMGGPLDGGDGAAGATSGSSQREVEYAVGRQVAQVVSRPGSIKRIQVVAVVKKALDAREEERIARTVAASVGASPERGDTVVVHSIGAIAVAAREAVPLETGAAAAAAADVVEGARAAPEAPGAGVATPSPRTLAAGALALVAAIVAAWGLTAARRRRARAEAAPARAARKLSDAERQAALAQVQVWLRGGDAGRGPREVV